MPHEVPSATGKRWFHTLVVIGASLTGGAGCGSGSGLSTRDAGHLPDGRSSTEGDVLAEAGGGESGSTGTGGSDAGAEAAPAEVDARVEYPTVLIIP
jgi:hypothetical protein